MKTYTEQDLRLAFRAGINMGKYFEAKDKYFKPKGIEDVIDELNPENRESTIGFTYGHLKRKFDWDTIINILCEKCSKKKRKITEKK